jgi:hypothetical protein
VVGNVCGQRGLARIWTKKPEVQIMQATKMVTQTLIEKTVFSKFSPLYFIFFSSNSLNIDFLFQLCLTTADVTQEFV